MSRGGVKKSDETIHLVKKRNRRNEGGGTFRGNENFNIFIVYNNILNESSNIVVFYTFYFLHDVKKAQ